jgi:hypothetical protein
MISIAQFAYTTKVILSQNKVGAAAASQTA